MVNHLFIFQSAVHQQEEASRDPTSAAPPLPTVSNMASVSEVGLNIIDQFVNITVTSTVSGLNFATENSTTNISTSTSSNTNEVDWLYTLPGPLICVFGIVCNVLNLCVLSQKKLSDSPYSYLTALACSDLSLLVLSLIHLMLKTPTYFQAFYNGHVFFVFGNVFFNSSVWLVVSLTIERMFFVIRPLTTRSSRKKAWILCTVIFMCCVVINIPRLFCFEIKEFNGNFYPFGTDFRGSQLFFTLCWFHAVIINFVPVVILIATNSVLIYTLHVSAQHRKALRSNREEANQREQQRLTRTLIIVVIVFFICTVPSAFVDDPIAYALFGQNRSWIEYISSPSNHLLIGISNMLLFLNSSLNFVLYCAFNHKFRRVAKRLVWRMKSRGKRILLRITDESDLHTTYSVSSATVTSGTTRTSNM